jgi:tRNA (cytidine/uridine-2'-O-)-methyltransferase
LLLSNVNLQRYVEVHDDWDAFHRYWQDDLGAPGRLVAFSKFGARPHAEEGAYRAGDWLLFGAETTVGVPASSVPLLGQ